MKLKSFKNKYSTKVNKNLAKRKEDFNWVLKITSIAFLMTFLFSLLTESTIPNVSYIISIFIVIIFILLGILFDMLGIAVTVADPKIFNSMCTKKIPYARASLKIMKKSSKVSSFCNDVVGDICGILSGSAGVAISIALSQNFGISQFLMTLIITSLIGALTIGGKALGKSVAINESNHLLYKFASFLTFFNKNLDK